MTTIFVVFVNELHHAPAPDRKGKNEEDTDQYNNKTQRRRLPVRGGGDFERYVAPKLESRTSWEASMGVRQTSLRISAARADFSCGK
jgi:hypothetical protein